MTRRKPLWACGLWLSIAVAAAACRTPPPKEAPPTASRSDVALALYRQLELVLARHERLADDETNSGRAEKNDLLLLAAEIAVRIVRVDPNADVDGLLLSIGSFE